MTQREEFEKWCKANKYTALYFSDNMYFDKATQIAWEAWQTAKSTSFNLPECMDYEFHGDKVINDPFADGYNQCLSDVISMNEEYANSTVSDGWIPVSERLPDDYSMSICVGHGGYQFICRKESNGWFRFPQMKKLDGVTHWMPLPAAPVGDK